MSPGKENIRNGILQTENSDNNIVEYLSKTSEAGSLLSALFCAFPLGVLVFDDYGNIRDANSAALSFLEYELAELLELNLTEILFEKKGKTLQYPFDGILTENLSDQHYYFRTKHKYEIPVVIKTERSFIKEMRFIIFEEKARKGKEEFTQKEQTEYKLIKNMFEGSSIGVEVFNPKGELITLNKACLKIYGVESDAEIRKVNLFDLPNVGLAVKNALKQSFSAQVETVLNFDSLKELFATSRSGVIDVNISLTLLKQKGEKGIHGYMLHLQDITRRKLIEKQLLNYNRELILNKALLEKKTRELTKLNEKLEISEKKLVNANAKRDKFFSLLAHDLKAPFNSLLGFSEYLISYSGEMSVQELRDFSISMNKSAQKLFNLLENLLQWSRFQTGRIKFAPSKWNIYNLIEQVIELYADSSKQKNIKISNLADKTHNVFADSNMVNTVLRNLLSNAIKFSYSGGSVQISSIERHNTIEISVSDNGTGMDKDTLKNLFKLDNRLSIEGTAKEAGTGLGLIICREFIRKNKGMIKAESEEGKGSVFTFSLMKEKIKN